MSKTLYYICLIALIIFIIYSFYKYRKYWKKILYEPILDPISAKNPIKVLDPKNNTLVSNPNYVESLKSSNFIQKSSEPSTLGLAYTFSFWIYIEDWNYKFDREKRIISWNPNLLVTLSKKTNDLNIIVPIYGATQSEEEDKDLTDLKLEAITYKEVPLQKWIHIVIVLDNRNLDLCINGKLYKSKYLSNVPYLNKKNDIEICPGGGFRGYFSNMKIYQYPLLKNSIIPIIFKHNIITLFKQGPFGRKFPMSLFKKLIDKVKGSVSIDINVGVGDSEFEVGGSLGDTKEKDGLLN